MPIILITGAPGWIGTRLVQALQEDLPGLPSTAIGANGEKGDDHVLP